MKILDFANLDRGDARLVRTAAITFIGATAIVALYFGQEVLIPAAVAMLFAFILGPAVIAGAPRPAAAAGRGGGGAGRPGRSGPADGAGHDPARRGRRQPDRLPGQPAAEDPGHPRPVGGRRRAQPLRLHGRLARPRPRGDGRPDRAAGGARAERRLEFRERGRLRGAADASAADRSASSSSSSSSSCSTATISATSSSGCSAEATCMRRRKPSATPPPASAASCRCSS